MNRLDGQRSVHRIKYVNGKGYNLMWIIDDIKGAEFHILFELHSFDMETYEDIDQLIKHTTIKVPSDYCDLEIEAQIMQHIRKHYPELCVYVCIN